MHARSFLLLLSATACGADILIRFTDQDGIDGIDGHPPELDSDRSRDASADTASDLDAGLPSTAQCMAFPSGCPEPEQAKCTLVDAQDGEVRSACVNERGTQAIGQACVRVARGDDDCAAGRFCSALGTGLEQAERYRCIRLCSTNVACTSGEHCLQVNKRPDRARAMPWSLRLVCQRLRG